MTTVMETHSVLHRLLEAQSSNNAEIWAYDKNCVRRIDEKEFEGMTGVRFIQYPQLDPNLPPEFYDAMEQEAAGQMDADKEYLHVRSREHMESRIEEALGKENFWEHLTSTELRYLYGDQISKGTMAPVYIGRVSEVLENKRFDAAGYGLFSREKIVKGQFIGQITGKIERVEGDSRDGSYALIYRGMTPTFILNCLEMSNSLRFLNHSKADNALTLCLFYEGLCRTILIAEKDIQKGDQILLDYGADYWVDMGIEPIDFSD